MIWPADARVVRSEPVRRDLERKMADPQSLFFLSLILGGGGIAMGVLAFTSTILGVLAISIVAAALAVLLLATRAKALHRLSESSRS